MTDTLLDPVAFLQPLLEAGMPGFTVARELDETSADLMPMVLYDATGSSDEAVVNGPGLWDIGVVVSVLAGSESAAQDAAEALDSLIMSWDMPGEGWFPDVGGVSRVEREQMFDHVYKSDVFDKDVRQADATYRMRMRNLA